MADLVQRLAAEAPPGSHDVMAATCLYAIYDPVTRRCAMASAGHPPPVLVRPDGRAEAVGLLPGPPLTVCGMPYETTVIELSRAASSRSTPTAWSTGARTTWTTGSIG
ncbi:serine/threonine-protein phosphatase [Streptomyces sp. HUAS TT20]|nr:PP2C family protein-serine/threonine phosphatase [Streptomyces sp. HUAS 15-9]UXY30439.1 serine/threonine-protein phosphatase [Streptomyces sp. HUAS 15-9]